MNIFNPEHYVLNDYLSHSNKHTATRQTVFLLQAYPSSSRDDLLVLLALVPKYFQGQSSHVLAGEEKNDQWKQWKYIFCKELSLGKIIALTPPFYTMLYNSEEMVKKRQKKEIRHRTMVTEPLKNEEIQKWRSCHLLNRSFSHRTSCLWPIRRSLKPGHGVTDDMRSLFKGTSFPSLCLWSSNWIYCPLHQHLLFWKIFDFLSGIITVK